MAEVDRRFSGRGTGGFELARLEGDDVVGTLGTLFSCSLGVERPVLLCEDGGFELEADLVDTGDCTSFMD